MNIRSQACRGALAPGYSWAGTCFLDLSVPVPVGTKEGPVGCFSVDGSWPKQASRSPGYPEGSLSLLVAAAMTFPPSILCHTLRWKVYQIQDHLSGLFSHFLTTSLLTRGATCEWCPYRGWTPMAYRAIMYGFRHSLQPSLPSVPEGGTGMEG